MASESSHQVIILDMNPYIWKLNQWEKSKGVLSLREYLNLVYIFTKAHIMLHKDNSIQILAANPSGCKVLYPESSTLDNHLHLDVFLESLLMLPLTSGDGDGSPHIHYLAHAISRSLCTINRKLQVTPSKKSKILCLQGSLDAPPTYNSSSHCK